ncbi:MAG: hypothetical protein RI556_04315 [Hydrogenovibrio sp.]|uniref:hypothetical protein n=1 Tax=Hydrogenovibrio sp. TaxID=2065821 RepID=UPI00286FC6AA|nr:hypothetical protein [Hydrogenovibrio sp.]MDR9498378.1 hypothetical protein [Hydrogenovibrio sp.]
MFCVHPNIYQTGSFSKLLSLLEILWIKDTQSGDGTIYIVSGFANFNGGARFYRVLSQHVQDGGQVVAILGGSTRQRLSTKQVVDALLDCGAKVFLINRKKLLHAKCYGWKSAAEGLQSLVVTSGNFTGPGMSLNIEASVLIEDDHLAKNGFDWESLVDNLFQQNFQIIECSKDQKDPCWKLLYDEESKRPRKIEAEEPQDEFDESLIVTLGHADTARIQANPGTNASKGSQYFWLSKDCFDFFPPLTIRNDRGIKGTLSCKIDLTYIDLQKTQRDVRVTFEAENNLDFRLGTGKLRSTKLAKEGDIACLTREDERSYSLKIFRQGEKGFKELSRYATTLTGHQGKRYGFVPTDIVKDILICP